MQDRHYTYMVTKKEPNTSVNTKKLVGSIIWYVQNNEVYFKEMPTFVENVLVFTIIGYRNQQRRLKQKLGKIIDNEGCILEILNRGI